MGGIYTSLGGGYTGMEVDCTCLGTSNTDVDGIYTGFGAGHTGLDFTRIGLAAGLTSFN